MTFWIGIRIGLCTGNQGVVRPIDLTWECEGYRGMGNGAINVEARTSKTLDLLRDIEGHVKVDPPTTR